MARQSGQAALILLLLLVIGGSALFFSLSNPNKIALDNDKTTADALALAKEALIGYAAGQPGSDVNYRPGELPCPDRDDNGVDDDGGSRCDSVQTRIGRLPWKTLGLPDLRDGSGERLWYAVSNVFKNATKTGVLNSETPGDFTVTVTTASGTTTVNNVIAVIFAPGPALAGQDRNALTTAACATTGGTTVARSLCAANYLEGTNKNGTTALDAGLTTTTFNDKLFLLTRENFFPSVEMRVARDIRANLLSYYSSYGYYPYAAPFGTASSTNGTFRGQIPTSYPSPQQSLTRPGYFDANNWQQVMVYAVAPRCTPRLTGGPWINLLDILGLGCTSWFFGLFSCPIDPNSLNCNNTSTPPYLTVSGTGSIRAVVMPASYPLTGQTRPCTTASACLEDAENTDTDDYIYVKPVNSATNNDSLVIVAP